MGERGIAIIGQLLDTQWHGGARNGGLQLSSACNALENKKNVVGESYLLIGVLLIIIIIIIVSFRLFISMNAIGNQCSLFISCFTRASSVPFTKFQPKN